MHHTGAMRGCRECHLFSPVSMHGVEPLATTLEQNADQIDQDLRIASSRFHGGRIAHIRLYGMDLADPAEWLQKVRKFGPADGDPDAIVTLGQGPNHVPAKKTRAAVDSDQRVIGVACDHAALNSFAGRVMSRNPANTGSAGDCTAPNPLH